MDPYTAFYLFMSAISVAAYLSVAVANIRLSNILDEGDGKVMLRLLATLCIIIAASDLFWDFIILSPRLFGDSARTDDFRAAMIIINAIIRVVPAAILYKLWKHLIDKENE